MPGENFIDIVHPPTGGTGRVHPEAFELTWKGLGWLKAEDSPLAEAPATKPEPTPLAEAPATKPEPTPPVAEPETPRKASASTRKEA